MKPTQLRATEPGGTSRYIRGEEPFWGAKTPTTSCSCSSLSTIPLLGTYNSYFVLTNRGSSNPMILPTPLRACNDPACASWQAWPNPMHCSRYSIRKGPFSIIRTSWVRRGEYKEEMFSLCRPVPKLFARAAWLCSQLTNIFILLLVFIYPLRASIFAGCAPFYFCSQWCTRCGFQSKTHRVVKDLRHKNFAKTAPNWWCTSKKLISNS